MSKDPSRDEQQKLQKSSAKSFQPKAKDNKSSPKPPKPRIQRHQGR